MCSRRNARAVLERILQSVLAAHVGEQMHLSLLLPENIAVDPARLAALRDWCQGFLFGFGLGGEAAAARLSAQGRELLRDHRRDNPDRYRRCRGQRRRTSRPSSRSKSMCARA
jgi:uncharacterized protein YgfB (UPF0149 family)